MRYLKTYENKFGYIVGDYVKHRRTNKDEIYIISKVDYSDTIFPYQIKNIRTNNTNWVSPDELKKPSKIELQTIKYNI